jgi:dipeptidyl-peptidase-4
MTEMSCAPNFPRLQAITRQFSLGVPKDFRISPDEARVTFLRSKSGIDPRHCLYCLDLATQTVRLLFDASTVDESTHRPDDSIIQLNERRRIQHTGVTRYSVDATFRMAVVEISGGAYTVDLETGHSRRLPISAPAVDVEINPSGTHISYVHRGELWLYDLDRAATSILAGRHEGSSEAISYGLAEFVASEEMGRDRGYWWAPHGNALLVARVDDSLITPRWVRDPSQLDTPPTAIYYPTAGSRNAEVTLRIVHLNNTALTVGWDTEQYPYLVRARWQATLRPLLAVQSRDQREMAYLSIDPKSGATTTIYEQRDPYWVHLFPGTPAWDGQGRFVRIEPLAGRYALIADSEVLSGPELNVRTVQSCDDGILFTANHRNDASEIHLYLARNGGVVPLTTTPGLHTATRRGATHVTTSRSLREPPCCSIRSNQFGEITLPTVAREPPVRPEPELMTVGRHNLRCALLLPRDHHSGTRLPVLLAPYGGPSAQRVLHSRNEYLEPQWFADNGFAVLIVDGRTTPGRGPDSDRLLHGGFVDIEVEDQVEGLLAVADTNTDLDLTRVAIRGWSHGGYLAACALARRPDIFCAAIVGAAVSDWRQYDTYFTERYLGDPTLKESGYDRNSLIGNTDTIDHPILLIHGQADDNVHLHHTLNFAHVLRTSKKEPDLLLLPGVTHLPPVNPDTAENLLYQQVGWLHKVVSKRPTGDEPASS